jgi:uncharacterized protein
MAIPENLTAVDLCLNIPGEDNSQWFEFIRPLLMDKESRDSFKMPAQYMFKNIPNISGEEDFIAFTVAEMDKYNIRKAMLDVDEDNEVSKKALERFPDRFFSSLSVDPNRGMDEVRKIVRLYKKFNLKAVTGFPAGTCPQVPINDKKWYPIYAKLVELDLPFCVCVGVPGPRLPFECQKVELLDEVCWFFPELKVVMRHGAEPWVQMACKLMLKYPNLYYSTSAFAPSHYPEDIIQFANKRGAEKIMYAGYFPMGLSLERIFKELQNVPFKDHVWAKFLGENATRVFKLDV